VQTRIVDEILRLEPKERVLLLAELNEQERYVISQMLDAELTNKWAKYEHDPVGFVLDGKCPDGSDYTWKKRRR
jgi:hypothetical protein